MEIRKRRRAVLSDYFKNNKSDTIWWISELDDKGQFIFSFDKKINFNLFADYPKNLTPKQKKIFDKENPFWKDFFRDR